jgi:hypothetical protein
MQTITSGPPHSIPEGMLMQQFVGGLNPEGAHHFLGLGTKHDRGMSTRGVFDQYPRPTVFPTAKQQVHTLPLSI